MSMKSPDKGKQVLCQCDHCGPGGQWVHSRTKKRHQTAQIQPAVSFADFLATTANENTESHRTGGPDEPCPPMERDSETCLVHRGSTHNNIVQYDHDNEHNTILSPHYSHELLPIGESNGDSVPQLPTSSHFSLDAREIDEDGDVNIRLDGDTATAPADVDGHENDFGSLAALQGPDPCIPDFTGFDGDDEDVGLVGEQGPLDEPPELEPNEEARSQIPSIQTTLDFIHVLKTASLDAHPSRLRERCRNPPEGTVQEEVKNDVDLRTSLDLFLTLQSCSERIYEDVRQIFILRNPESNILSYAAVKKKIAELTGITSLIHDMCVNSCIAFVGPFAQHSNCSICYEPRYRMQGTRKVARQTFHTIPVGPQIQALFQSVDTASAMEYRTRLSKELYDLSDADIHEEYTDIFDGSEYEELYVSGEIGEDHVVIGMAADGAQLLRNKASDCWMWIWIIYEIGPNKRYKKRFVLPGGFVPGPNKPKLLDTFLFPSFYHLAALQNHPLGLAVWNAITRQVVNKHIYFLLAGADGPGLSQINGLNGHKGAKGCRGYCGMPGRRADKSYSPAHLKPLDYHVKGSDHPDILISEIALSEPSVAEYQRQLHHLIQSPNQTQYKSRRLSTGITKPSLLSGLPRALPIPRCFGSDSMHLGFLNIPDLLFALWRGQIECKLPDVKTSWDFAVFQDAVLWKVYGQAVVLSTPYCPGRFEHVPRNPVEKINSGYKAKEFGTLLYGYGPAMLYKVLPDKYWRHFCKLVRAMRILHQRTIKAADLQEMDDLMQSFVLGFEELYYQRKPQRLHYCRPSIHALVHLAREVTRLGPCSIYSQWLLERTIGDLTSEIHQFSHIYANLSQCGLLRAQTNALRAMVPDLDPEKYATPSHSCVLGDNYILLHPRDEKPIQLHGAERMAIKLYLEAAEGRPVPEDWKGDVRRWARIQLPDEQYIRAAWKEVQKSLNQTRISRVVKMKEGEIAEVRFFFQAKVNSIQHNLALISLFSPQNDYLYNISSGTVRTGVYKGDTELRIIEIKTIIAGVAMIPWRFSGVSIRDTATAVTNDPNHSGLTARSGDRAEFKEGETYFEVDKLTLGLVEPGGGPISETDIPQGT